MDATINMLHLCINTYTPHYLTYKNTYKKYPSARPQTVISLALWTGWPGWRQPGGGTAGGGPAASPPGLTLGDPEN